MGFIFYSQPSLSCGGRVSGYRIHSNTVLLLKIRFEIGEQVSTEETVKSISTLSKRSSLSFRQ